jgi:hypothetical protein
MKKAVPFLLLGMLVLFVVLIQVYAPRNINWKETFEKKDKNPFGDFILYGFMKDLFPNKKIEVKDRTIYETIGYYDYATSKYIHDTTSSEQQSPDKLIDENNDSASFLIDSTVSALDTLTYDDPKKSRITHNLRNQYDPELSDFKNYIIINSTFSPGETDAKALLNFVKEGNCAFIAAEKIEGILADSLNLKINIEFYERDFSKKDVESGPKKDSIYLTLLNNNLKTSDKKYWYRDGSVTGYFASFDTANSIVLGKNSKDQANFIRIQYGTGIFLISTTPLAFTNYNMVLANNAEYISASLSYLPLRDTYWDEYYKNYRVMDSSKFRFIKSQPPLLWAYYITFFSAITYILFETKRRQRIIPVVAPPRNTTVEFVSTIGRLYFQNGNHKDIAGKKIHYFLEYVRTNFYLNTNIFDQEFIDKLSERSGVNKTKVSQLFALIQHIQKNFSVNQKELMELNKRLEEFKGKA